MSNTICLVTQNPGKVLAAKNIFVKYDVELIAATRDFPEIQAPTSLEIARHTALEAAQAMRIPSIREDHSLFIGNLELPGPFTNYWEKKIPAQKLLELLKKLDIWEGYFEVATVYADLEGKMIESVFQVPMTFGKEEKGEKPHGWNGLIRLHDETRAITEYPEEERLHIWNQGYERIASQIVF